MKKLAMIGLVGWAAVATYMTIGYACSFAGFGLSLAEMDNIPEKKRYEYACEYAKKACRAGLIEYKRFLKAALNDSVKEGA